jgi:hypothetical protein
MSKKHRPNMKTIKTDGKKYKKRRSSISIPKNALRQLLKSNGKDTK